MAVTHLFIDTNVLLNFYSFADDGLDQLVRLIEVVNADGICLHLPQQVINELARNREAKIKVANEQFTKETLPSSIPRHMQNYPQAEEYAGAIELAKKARKQLISLVVADASNQTLKTDFLLKELFEKATIYPENDTVFARALQRMQKGNPPGKNGSVGDQYNWETLLQEVPAADLYIVSKDGDYVSTLNKARPHPYLEAEWQATKGFTIHLYSELKSFLDRYHQMMEQPVPQEVLIPTAEQQIPQDVQQPVETQTESPAQPIGSPSSPEQSTAELVAAPQGLEQIAETLYFEKNMAINGLVNSSSFSNTHGAISRIKPYQWALTKTDAEQLISAAVNNAQIRWIATDSDVYSFFSSLLTEHSDINPDLFEEAVDLFGLKPEPSDPFDD